MVDIFPIETIRHEFPSLSIGDNGRARIYLDNPAGTQVPLRVADAVHTCYLKHNANLGGEFITSREAGTIVQQAHAAVADFLGAASSDEIIIGPSMTTLTFHISRSIAKTIGPGDEIVVTRMDHDGNVAPWLAIAQDTGASVRWLPFDTGTWMIEPASLDGVLSKKTRLVALNAASNLTGSINDVAALVARIHEYGALVYVDAVQLAPHAAIDVRQLDCDFLSCSSYKFYGPHLGIVYGRRTLLASLQPYKVRAMGDDLPDRWETGTPQIELQAGLHAAIGYYEWLGNKVGTPRGTSKTRSSDGSSSARRTAIREAFGAIKEWEEHLAAQLIAGLSEINGITIHGITDPEQFAWRVPTVSFTHARKKPQEVAAALAARNIFIWGGHNYALEIVRTLGISDSEGVVRIGLAHYNTPEEVDATLAALEDILGRSN